MGMRYPKQSGFAATLASSVSYSFQLVHGTETHRHSSKSEHPGTVLTEAEEEGSDGKTQKG